MRQPIFYLSIGLLLFLACKSDGITSKAEKPTLDTGIRVIDSLNGFGYEILDTAFTALVDIKAPIEILASGFQWSEGPVWVPAINSLIFNDVPNNVTYRWGPKSFTAEGENSLPKPVGIVTEKGSILGVDTFLYPSGYISDPGIKGEAGANGLILDKEGRLWLAQHGERQVAIWGGIFENFIARRVERESTGSRRTYAETTFTTVINDYEGGKFNSPNDLVLADNGDLYFTDPTYGIDQTFGEDARELGITGVYRVKKGSSRAELLYSGLLRPNGVVMTRDQKYFIVSSSESKRSLWMKCDASSEPMAEADRCKLFADVTSLRSEQNSGNCDGMVMHPSGIMLATGPGGVLCFSESGKHLGTIRTGRPTANVTLGGPDGKDIFITANQLLLRTRVH